jgi:TLC domain
MANYLFLHKYPSLLVHSNNLADLYQARQQRPQDTPLWLSGMYIVLNLFLNCLNLYWFSKMIDSLRRRAEVKQKHDHED